MNQTGAMKLLVIIVIAVVAVALAVAVMYFLVLRDKGDTPAEPVEEKPCEKAYMELEEFQDMAINPNGPQRAIIQLSLLFEHCADDKKVPLEMERVLPLLKADINLFLQSQTLEDYSIENRHMLEEELRVLVNNHLEDVEKGLTAVRVTSFVVQYL